MSSVVKHAGALKPEIRLAQAVSAFEADLPGEQKAAFRISKNQAHQSPPDLSDVMRLTAEIDRRATGRRCIGPRLTNFLLAAQQYAGLGDVVLGGSQNIVACSMWAVLLVNFSTHLERLSTMFMTIGRAAPRYRILGLLYPRSKTLQSALSEYFLVVVRLCHNLLSFTQKSAIAQIASALSDSSMKAFQTELEGWSSSIKEEVNILMAKRIEEEARENNQFRALSAKLSRSMSEQQRLATRLRVLDFCSTYDYQTTWKQTRKSGNVTLLERSSEYQAWKRRTDDCVLIWTGKLGSGKSVLMANVVDDIHLHAETTKATICYFFCRYDIPESVKARTVFGSFIRQLLQSVSDLTGAAELIDRPIPDNTQSTDILCQILERSIPSGHKAYFILDGFNECCTKEKQTFVALLRASANLLALSLCISLRSEPGASTMLQSDPFVPDTICLIPDGNPDIETFIQATLEDYLETKQLVLGSPGLVLEIRDALLQGAQGMFLWVALQFQALCLMKTDDAIRSALADLPRDLPETYRRILLASKDLAASYQRPILEFISVARRPLTKEELREALSVIIGNSTWDPSKLVNDTDSTLACCGCLITVDEDELTVRFVHPSVNQYLMACFTEGASQTRMAGVIVTYLSYSVFETQLTTFVAKPLNAAPLPSKIIQSTGDSSSTVRRFALSLLRSRKQPDCDIGKVLHEMAGQAENLPAQFYFRGYAQLFWLDHVAFMSWNDDRMHKMLRSLFTRKVLDIAAVDSEGRTLLAKIADWDDIASARPVSAEMMAVMQLILDVRGIDARLPLYDQEILILIAIKNNNEYFVDTLLRNTGWDPDSRHIHHDGRTSLSLAASYGSTGVVSYLLDTQRVNINSADCDGMTPILRAVRNGHCGVVRALIKGPGLFSINHEDLKNTLRIAVEKGHTDIVECLLNACRNDLSYLGIDRTVFTLAVENGHVAIARLLLESGEVAVAPYESGWVPLWQAVVKGNEDMVQLLLANGADPFITDPSGSMQSVVKAATVRGYDGIRKLLVFYRECLLNEDIGMD